MHKLLQSILQNYVETYDDEKHFPQADYPELRSEIDFARKLLDDNNRWPADEDISAHPENDAVIPYIHLRIFGANFTLSRAGAAAAVRALDGAIKEWDENPQLYDTGD